MSEQSGDFTMSEALYWAKASQKMPRDDVERLQRFLRQRALDVGCREGVADVISGMTDRFVDEEREMLRRRIDEYVRSNGILEQQRIDATDDQIIEAIKQTLPYFESDWDWGGIYRILVDYCRHLGFTNSKADFVRRFARMGIYPKDNIIKVDRYPNPAIYQDEYNGHPFSYQAIQKGVNAYWPDSYEEWKKSDITSNDFVARKNIADCFCKNLLKAAKY